MANKIRLSLTRSVMVFLIKTDTITFAMACLETGPQLFYTGIRYTSYTRYHFCGNDAC